VIQWLMVDSLVCTVPGVFASIFHHVHDDVRFDCSIVGAVKGQNSGLRKYRSVE
jgi:hypothetical protein